MSFESNAPAAHSPTDLSRNVVALRPRRGASVTLRQPAPVYRVRVGAKIFQGPDLKALLKLAVQARVAERAGAAVRENLDQRRHSSS